MADNLVVNAPSSVAPILASTEDMEGWTVSQPLLMKAAAWWNRCAPRAKGALPRWISRNCGAKWRVIIQTRSGIKLAADPRSIDVYLTILREGTWEPWITRTLVSAIRSGDIYVDVGANVGCIALEIAQHTGARIYAFEPQIRLARMIAISARMNDFNQVTVYSAAVGEKPGTVTLHVPSHSVHASLAALSEKCNDLQVPMVSLDAMVEAGELPIPTVIKVDVEGAEFQVLRGSQRILQKHSPILLVEANYNSGKFDYTRESVLHWITQQSDYTFFLAAPGDVLCIPSRLYPEMRAHFEGRLQVLTPS